LCSTPIAAGGVPPSGADFNGILNAITAAVRWSNAGGQYAYDSAFSTAIGGYPKGALIARSGYDGYWQNTVENNTSNPDAGGAGWISLNGQGGDYGIDTGSANIYTVAYAPAVVAITDGMTLKFKAKTGNTGASTFSPNGLGAKPIVGSAHAALQGGEIVANGDVWLQYNSSIGAGSWVLIDSTGGALQVAPATHSQHAVPLGQVPTEALGGAALVATQAMVTAGADDATLVTPKKFLQGLVNYITQATETAFGWAKVATQAQTNSGVDDTTIVTPKKFSAGIAALIGQATEVISGMAKVATQALVNAGADDATIVTPKKLRAGFSALFAANGYLALPTWLGGLIFQWGSFTGSGSGATQTFAFPLTFPNNCFTVGPGLVSSPSGSVEYVQVVSKTLAGVNAATYTDVSAATVGSLTFSWFAVGN
jgi:hypothetical protein